MEQLNYEAAVARLEEIVRQLENGNLPLEQMMALYEEGSALALRCAAALDAAQLKLTQLSEKEAPHADA